jgi:penicillin G amidase
MMKRRTARFSLVTLCLLSIAAAVLPVGAQSQAGGRQSLAGLGETVVVQRDERGVPYIQASDEGDLYFSQGYITASDRLWQMDVLRRTARGELAEILGNGSIEEDKQLRTYNFASVVEAAMANLSPAYRKALAAYARGVNAFIDSCDEPSLPLEFRLLKYRPAAWRPADTLVIGKLLSLMLSSTWQVDTMRALFSDLPPARLAALLPEISPLDVILVGSDKVHAPSAKKSQAINPALDSESRRDLLAQSLSRMRVLRGALDRVGLWSENRTVSNNWVVSGKHTVSGKPLLADDPHLRPSAPGIWYMTHLACPSVRVAGVTVPGIPGIMIGHNEQVAWGVTNLPADVQDVYVEKFDPHDPQRYQTPAGWRTVEVRHEVIKVRKNFASAETITIPFDVKVTRHGPVILESADRKVALQWTSLNSKSAPLEAFYYLNRAHNWAEFCNALRRYKEAPQNFVYADVKGHIGYYGAGEIPIRRSGDGSLPYDGTSDRGDWRGAIAFNKLPHLYDPPSGIIVTANNRIVGLDYPYLITREWAHPYRARRIMDLLRAGKRLTVEDCRSIQGDIYSFGGATFAREAARSSIEAARAGDDARWLETLRAFEKWDGSVGHDSKVALLVSEMRIIFRARILAEALGQNRWQEYVWGNEDTFIDSLLTNQPREWLPKKFSSYAELFHACYLDALASLRQRVGPDESQWAWGNVGSTQVIFPHALDAVPLFGARFKIRPFPQDGSSISLATVNAGANVSMRFIADLSDWDASQLGLPLGESGDPASRHWTDQLGDWRAVTPRRFPFTPRAVAEAVKATITLAPVAGGK